MSDFDTTPETTVTDDSEGSFAVELAKTGALSLASSIGVLGGMALVGLGVGKLQERRDRKAAEAAAAKAAQTTPTEA